MCLVISFKSFQRELSIDMAEHTSTLKIFQNTYYPRFSFIPKTEFAFPKKGGCFYCVHYRLAWAIFFLILLGVAIDPTCINIGRLERT